MMLLMEIREIDGQQRLVADVDMCFSLPNSETLSVKKGDVGAVLIGKNQIDLKNIWATKNVRIKNSKIKGPCVISGDVDIDGCHIVYDEYNEDTEANMICSKDNTSLKDTEIIGPCVIYGVKKIKIDTCRILYENKKNNPTACTNIICGNICVVQNSVLTGTDIHIEDSLLKGCVIASGSQIFDSNVEDTTMGKMCLITKNAEVKKSVLAGQSAIVGEVSVNNCSLAFDSEISGKARLRGCSMSKSSITDNVVVDNLNNEDYIIVSSSAISGNSDITGKNISIQDSIVKGSFKIKSNAIVKDSFLNCDNESYPLGGQKNATVEITGAQINSKYDYFYFRTPQKLYVVYAGKGLKGGFVLRKWEPTDPENPRPSYPIDSKKRRLLCLDRLGMDASQDWADWFANTSTDTDMGEYVAGQVQMLLNLFGEIPGFRPRNYKDLLVWSMLSFASHNLQKHNADEFEIDKNVLYGLWDVDGNRLKADLSVNIEAKKIVAQPRLFVTKHVFDKICFDSGIDEKTVYTKLQKSGCIFVGFIPALMFCDKN